MVAWSKAVCLFKKDTKMLYKLIELMIDELVRVRMGMNSEEFKRDVQDAINSLKKIKRYF